MDTGSQLPEQNKVPFPETKNGQTKFVKIYQFPPKYMYYTQNFIMDILSRSLEDLPFATLMWQHTRSIPTGIQLGKENGLTLLLDAEVTVVAVAAAALAVVILNFSVCKRKAFSKRSMKIMTF